MSNLLGNGLVVMNENFTAMKKIFTIVISMAFMASMQAQTMSEYAEAGDAAMANEKYQDAADNYIKALELDKENSDFMTAYQLAIAYLMLGENEKSGDAFKLSLIKGNDDKEVIANMKESYEAAGKTDLVKQALNEIKSANPKQALEMDKELYAVYTKEKDWNNAVSCAKTILNDPSNDEETNLMYTKIVGQLYSYIGEPDSVNVYYEKVLAFTPNDANIHKALGYGLYNAIQEATNRAQAKYNANKTQHEYAMMQTATKRATLNYGPKAIEHLKIANETLKDAQITQTIAKLQNNIAVYKK